jgi:ubiquinone/menaquinone biosynthesis C-methylase UbiE
MAENHPSWLFDETKQVGVDYTDKELVCDYDKQHEGFRDFEQEAKKIASALDLSERSAVLDVGCGTGGLTTHLAQICRHVYAVDVSGTMIDTVRAKIRDQGLANVSPIQSGFLTYEHEGMQLDAIIANITLHHLPDFWKQIALCRFYDLLGPGGKLFLADVVFGFDPRTYREAIDNWLDGMRVIAGQQMAEETVVHVRDEFSTWEWVVTGMLERAGFRIDGDPEVMPNMRAYVCSK